MDLVTQFESLEKRSSAGLTLVRAAATESREKLEQRIGQAQVDVERTDAKQEVGEAARQRQGKWAQMRADASAKMEDIKAKIDKRNDQIDADMAATEADFAEADASDAIAYAGWVVDNARLAVLDALDARAYADERAKAATRNP
ncbi:hypothetical protein IU459_10320 [Nocardia amamiensis]|uniref:Uncharacterized protein n=1 Tax=Nocardia amamiensis TaxID=404578 RepID=A0ABS0CNT2_9NOCA|nr:hypothetical protein [Nocardia amamiensis]MBF6297941.1 hypothetical protein [Nocardia amamiensis]